MASSFVLSLKKKFQGDIDCKISSRLVYSFDNSIYQKIPKGILFPKNPQDVQEIFLLANREEYNSVFFSARGGGTGTNGQSLSNGWIIDFSRYMNQCLYVDSTNRSARVQPGLIRDTLNKKLNQMGLFFSPHVSTSSRATIGGMIATDAAGKGSSFYGRTSNRIKSLLCVLSNGELHEFSEISIENAKSLALEDTFLGRLYKGALSVCVDSKDEIMEWLPKLTRHVTGYAIQNVYNEKRQTINLCSLLCGSEGTLACIVEAEIELDPVIQDVHLGVCTFFDLEPALRFSSQVISLRPIAVEMIDGNIINRAKSSSTLKSIFQKYNSLFENKSICFLCEWSGVHLKENEIKKLCSTFEMGFQWIPIEDQKTFWTIRSKGVELLSQISPDKQPIAFMEDTVVPPDKMNEYLLQVKGILDNHGINYGMFGHADVGCVHIRPALDLFKKEDAENVRKISNEIFSLVQTYGGIYWGEHGKGLRSSFAPEFFGKKVFPLICSIKKSWDSQNQLNPGKLAVPHDNYSELERLDQKFWKEDYKAIRNHLLDNSLACNGNAACQHESINQFSCPSYQMTKNKSDTPKGRAILYREWYRNQSDKVLEEEVKESFKNCLSCGICETDCPVSINIPKLKTDFLFKTDLGFSIQAYGEYLFEKWVPKFLLSPISGYKIVQYFLPPLFRYTILPKFDKNFGLQNLGVEFWNESKDVEKAVILTFESSLLLFHTSMLRSCIKWLKAAGWTPYLAKPHANGKSLLNKGRVDWFQSLHQDTQKFYASISIAKIPVLCLDPGLFPTYKDLGIDVQYFPFWAKSNLKPEKNDFRELRVTMVSHCVEHSLDAFSDWQELFAKWGVQLVHKPLGCCGMAGTWGLEKRNRKLFRANFIKNWLGHFADDDIIVNGSSCIGACQNFGIKNVMSPYEWVESNILNYPKL